jgi:hypothetical protein
VKTIDTTRHAFGPKLQVYTLQRWVGVEAGVERASGLGGVVARRQALLLPRKLMRRWAGLDRNVMGSAGIAEAIQARLPNNVDLTAYAAGTLLLSYTPNIVMIDFADENKCNTICGLNYVAAAVLTNAAAPQNG